MALGDELDHLVELHAQGSLTDAEFEAAKHKVLAGTGPPAQDMPPSSPPPSGPRQKTNGLAIASLVLGLIGMGVGHIFALVFGYRARRQIDASRVGQRGRGLAIAGIVLGWIGVGALVTLAGVVVYMHVWGGGIDFKQPLARRAATVEELKNAVEEDAGITCDHWSELGHGDTGSTCLEVEENTGLEYDVYVTIKLVPDGTSPDSIVQADFNRQSDEDPFFRFPEICYVVTPQWVINTAAPSLASRLVEGIGGDLRCLST